MGVGGGARNQPSVRPFLNSLLWWLAFMRIFLGVWMLHGGITRTSWLGKRTLYNWVSWFLYDPSHPQALAWYAPFAKGTALTYPDLITFIVVFGNITVGILLIAGLWTRLAGLLAFLLLLNYCLLTWHMGMQWQAMTTSFMVMALTCMTTAAGRVFGFDYQFADKNPKSIFY